MGKLVVWLRTQYKNDNLRIFVVVVFTWLACFIKPIAGKTYTSWDTHDLGFVSFLYASDSLREGYLPIWNHLIQAGMFFPQLFNVGIFSPFQLVFIALSWFISPLYAYELMLQALVLVGGFGAYLLFRSHSNDRLIALFGATAFAVTVLVPVVGQVMFLFSLSSFPWIVLACIKINQTVTRVGWLRPVLWGTLLAMYISSGYVWMNFINVSIAVIFSTGMVLKRYFQADVQERKSAVSNLASWLIFLAAVTVVYGSLELPGYLNMRFNYSLFSGDYDSSEPHLRSLTALHHYSYSSIYKALVGAIDPRIVINDDAWQTDLPKWSWGGGWVLWIVFLAISTKKFLGQQVFWVALMTAAILYSAGDSNFAGKLIEKTPILNANRWWFCGVFYVTICLVFLAIPKMMALRARSCRQQKFSLLTPIYDLQALLVGVLSIYLLSYFKSSAFEFVLVETIVLLVVLLSRVQNRIYWKNLLTILICLNVSAIAYMPYAIPSTNHYLELTSDNGYLQQVLNREKSVVISKNYRRLGEAEHYIINDEQWLLNKIPFSHGDNPLGNPLYWYVKDESFFKTMVAVTHSVRKEATLQREDFATDNQFAEALMGDVLLDAKTPTIDSEHFRSLPIMPGFQWELKNLSMTPNTVNIQVKTNSVAYLIFNNVNAPGWEVYVNGEKADLLRTNRIFQGVQLNAPGTFEVEFKYRPKWTIALMLFPYLILMLCACAYFFNQTRLRSRTVKRNDAPT